MLPEPKAEESGEVERLLAESEEDILAAIGDSAEQSLTVRELSQSLGQTPVRVQHTLDSLQGLGFVSAAEDYADGELYYSLTVEGRRYAVEQDLVE